MVEVSLVYAWHQPGADRDVQLPFARGAGACEPPAAWHPGYGGRGVKGHIAVRLDVLKDQSTVNSARETAARAADPDALLDPQRTAVDGRDRLQHAVPLVCRHEPGRGGLGRDRVHE